MSYKVLVVGEDAEKQVYIRISHQGMALDIILGAPIVTAYLNGGSHSLLCYSSVAEKQQFWTKSWLKP